MTSFMQVFDQHEKIAVRTKFIAKLQPPTHGRCRHMIKQLKHLSGQAHDHFKLFGSEVITVITWIGNGVQVGEECSRCRRILLIEMENRESQNRF